MEKFKIIFFPIGDHDIAGNKRLKNLSKYLNIIQGVNIYFINLCGNKLIKKNKAGLLSYFFRVLFFIINLFYFLYILIREKKKGYKNILYFYEGENMMFHRIVAAKTLGYKIIVDLVENPNSLSHTNSVFRKIRVLYFLILYKMFPLYSSGVVVVSQYLKNKIENDFKNKLQVFLLPVSYDPDNFLVDKQRFSFPAIFYGGSYGNNYDFGSLFKAFNNVISEYPQLKLLLSGKMSDDLIKKIKDQIRSEENLVFLGFLQEDEYFKVISSVDILSMPRNNSVHANAGFPFKLAEYLATGKPVITSRVSDVSDYITESDAFIYEPGDFVKMESIIRDILQKPENALRIGENGKIKAQMHFDAKKMSQSFYNFISGIEF